MFSSTCCSDLTVGVTFSRVIFFWVFVRALGVFVRGPSCCFRPYSRRIPQKHEQTRPRSKRRSIRLQHRMAGIQLQPVRPACREPQTGSQGERFPESQTPPQQGKSVPSAHRDASASPNRKYIGGRKLEAQLSNISQAQVLQCSHRRVFALSQATLNW